MSHKFLLIQFFSTQYDNVIRQNIQVKKCKNIQKNRKDFKVKKKLVEKFVKKRKCDIIKSDFL